MKKFQFSLESVLTYKQSALDAVQTEYATALAKVVQQEQMLQRAEAKYAAINAEYLEEQSLGMTIAAAISYQMGLSVAEKAIALEQKKLSAVKIEADAVHRRLVASKIETSSLDLLREKKLNSYRKDIQKQDELMIEELFGSPRTENALTL